VLWCEETELYRKNPASCYCLITLAMASAT